MPHLIKNFLDSDPLFWAKVRIRGPNDCWLWRKPTKRGFGMCCRKGVSYFAHRYAYILAYGSISEIPNNPNTHHGTCVKQTCRNRACCNPAHLKPGTLFEGIKSRAERGAMGSFMGFKLTLAKVRRIRYLYHTAKIKQSTLAKVYHVSQPAISFIVRGVTWKEA